MLPEVPCHQARIMPHLQGCHVTKAEQCHATTGTVLQSQAIAISLVCFSQDKKGEQQKRKREKMGGPSEEVVDNQHKFYVQPGISNSGKYSCLHQGL